MKATITKSKTAAATIASIPASDDGRICIRATTDGVFAVSETYTGVQVEPLAGVSLELGDAWLSRAKLAGIVKLADHDVTVEGPVSDERRTGEHHRITSGTFRAIVNDGGVTEFGLLGLRPDRGAGSVAAADLLKAVSGVRSVAESSIRRGMDQTNGVMFEASDGVLRVVCTDGHRMAVSSIPAELTLPQAVVVPDALKDMQSWLARREGSVAVHLDEAMFWILGDAAVFGYRLKSRTYLDWRKLWGRASGKGCVMAAAELKRAQQSVAGIGAETVRLSVESGAVMLKTIGGGDDAEVGAGEILGGEAGAITLDPLFLAAATDVAGKELRVSWPTEATDPALFSGPVCGHLVMPKRA